MVNIKNKDIRAKDDFTEILTCTKERHVISVHEMDRKMKHDKQNSK